VPQREAATPAAATGTTVVVARVFLRVTNVGARRGFAVPQLYLSYPAAAAAAAGEPPLQLAGFAKLDLAPGAAVDVRMDLRARSASVWDVGARGWRRAAGEFELALGTSSQDMVLHTTIRL
jgi:beta-glucosidase